MTVTDAMCKHWLIAVTLLLATVRLSYGQSSAPVVVTGVVQDQTGAVLAGASIELVSVSGAAASVVQSTTADGTGAFKFEKVAPGQYELRATYEGFKPASARLRVGSRSPGAQKLVLAIAGLTQEITVSNAAAEVDATVSNNVDAVTVDQSMLESLPVFDHDYVATLSRFLDSGSLGTGGVTVVVNGMEVTALNVSASAVQQIRINQDPYSAEYSRPGRGRIEILTKPGSQAYHGETNLIFRDSTFNSRNAFSTTKPPEQRRIFEGFLGGPVGNGGKTSFMLSANDERDDNQAFIYALGPSGILQDTLPQASARALVTGSLTHQISDKNTFSIRPNYQYESDENRGAGGTTLASAATTFKHHEQQVTYTQQTIFRPTLINQFQMLLGHEREPTTSRTPDRGLVVAGAFTGGGAQGDLVRTETHINMNESLAWTHGTHLVQAGFQLPDWSRRGFYDHTNFGGTFFFSGLDALALRTPYAFTQQQGHGDLAFLEKQVGTYIKDDWQLRPGLSIGYGLRYDWQNYFHDDNNFAPRVSVAYAPGNTKTNVFRAGVGVFNDRSGPVVIADVLHSLPGGLTRYVITNPTYPDPLASAAVAAAQPPSIVQLAPDVQIPQTVQYSAGVDHQLQKSTTLSLTYTGARGYHLFRSRDVNAPLPPLYLGRPNPAYGVIRQVESNGRQNSDSLAVTLRGRVTRWFNGQMQYTLSRVYNDTNGIAWFPANDYDLSGEWGRADFDRRHRF
ncbi:MAG TPA: carboxypeptidase regulatory-like domain-containing protein, partial [Vicinamibacterales bacterium]|nr:carboxypeptidase regulatory-like domain-containing protein [Vicinamibacterales bacterium]